MARLRPVCRGSGPVSDTRGAAHAGWQSEPHRESAARVGWEAGSFRSVACRVCVSRREPALLGDSVDEFAVPGDDPGTFSKYSLNILIDFKPEDSPMRPETVELLKQNAAKRATDTPTLRCLPQGVPRAELFNYQPFKINQAAREMTVLYEMDNTYRQIYTDGRKLPVDPAGVRGRAIRWADGKVTRWLWTRRDSIDRAGWMSWDTRIAKRCESRSGSTGGTTATWI